MADGCGQRRVRAARNRADRFDTAMQVFQFDAITSTVQCCGRTMVAGVVEATPEDWHLALRLDWSDGLRQRTTQDYRRILAF